jgi:hypothetical protein
VFVRRLRPLWLSGAFLALLGVDTTACSKERPWLITEGAGAAGFSGSSGGMTTDGGPPTSGSGGHGLGTAGGIQVMDGGGGMTVDGSGLGGEGGEGTCAGEEHAAELIPLDMYIMLDRSLSMYARTSAGITKWDAVTQALASFAVDPRSEGIGVGIQYFPANRPCTANDECESGLCYLKACRASRRSDPSLPGLIPCARDTDCPMTGDTCVELGGCGDQSCVALDSMCDNGETCTAVTAGVCTSQTVCTLSDYTTPEVPIALLPEAATDLISSLGAYTPGQSPFGLTPTGPALEGAITHARAWADAHPERRVIVVLATDGAPTGGCTPAGRAQIAALASVAAGADNPVRTFTVGVFGELDPTDLDSLEGPDNIRAIAVAGDGEAFVISDQADVVKEFVDALNGIRGAGLSCDYQLPPPEDGTTLDYERVNVGFTASQSAEPEVIPYVEDPADCDEEGGWYYTRRGETEVAGIRVCGATCTRFTDSVTGSVSIRVGCKTKIKDVVK